jgi:hypothetical protein
VKKYLVITALLGVFYGRLAHAQVCTPDCATEPSQCCAIPSADTFMAYESDTHNGAIFRGIVPNTPGAACAVTTDINVTNPSVVNGPLAPVTVPLSPTVSLMFNLGEGIERWLSTGGLFDGGTCFTPEVSGFHHPNVQLTVTDGCGVHVVTIQRPAFFCIGPSFKLICFESRNVNGNNLPLPPGFDRPEDVCALAH